MKPLTQNLMGLEEVSSSESEIDLTYSIKVHLYYY